MSNDIESKMNNVKDSLKMSGINDRLEQIVRETEHSIGLSGAKALSEDELDMVAGGIHGFIMLNGKKVDIDDIDKTGHPAPRGGLSC